MDIIPVETFKSVSCLLLENPAFRGGSQDALSTNFLILQDLNGRFAQIGRRGACLKHPIHVMLDTP